MRLACLLLAVVFWGSACFEPMLLVLVEERGAVIRLEGEERGGELEVAVCLDSSGGICGALLDVVYDADEFLLLSVGAECGLSLSYVDRGGAVRILLDGVENCDAECALARIYFIRRAGRDGTAEFFIGGAEAYSLCAEGIVEAEITVGGGVYVGGTGADFCEGVELVSVSARLSEVGEVELGISLSAFGDAFSVGARMFFVDFGGGGECGEILVSSVGASRGGTVPCGLGVRGACCVVITPIAYVGRRRIEGEKRVAIINLRDGEAWVILI